MKKAVLFLVLLSLSGCARAPAGPPIVAVPPPTVALETPRRRTIDRAVTLPGNVLPWQQATLYAKVSGYLRAVRVDKGDAVRAGQLLATIAAPEMRQETSQAEAAYARSRANAQAAAAEVPRAGATLRATAADRRRALAGVRQATAAVRARQGEDRLARDTYRRLKSIRDDDPGLLPLQDLEVARTALEVAHTRVAEAQGAARAARMAADAAGSRVDAARRQVDVARARQTAAARQIDSDRAGVARAGQMQAYTEIRAPFTGVITRRFLDPGALVQTAAASAQQTTEPVLELADASTVRIQVQVPEPDAPRVRAGTEATIVADTLPQRPFHVRLRRVARALDTATRTMLAEAELPNRQGLLLPGMLVSVRLELERLADRWTVPASAVAFDKSKRFVFVCQNGKVKRQEVKTGVEGPEWVQITAGLKETDRIVVAGREGLSDGEAVRVSNPSARREEP